MNEWMMNGREGKWKQRVRVDGKQGMREGRIGSAMEKHKK